ncbi:MAG: RDD family protein [Bacillota bacterium]|nr:RDD family protein [Bacillota bacterium]
MNESKKCPNCKLINPEEAVLCDCGYNFELNKVDRNRNVGPIKTNYAGFFLRVLAYFIDVIPMMIILILFFLIFTDIKDVFIKYLDNPHDLQARQDFLYNYQNKIRNISTLLWIVYSIIFEASPLQGTLGKALLKIKVSNIDGSRITIGKAVIRNIFKLVSGFIVFIGLIMVAITKNKQGLHDIVAKTVVLKK